MVFSTAVYRFIMLGDRGVCAGSPALFPVPSTLRPCYLPVRLAAKKAKVAKVDLVQKPATKPHSKYKNAYRGVEHSRPLLTSLQS